MKHKQRRKQSVVGNLLKKEQWELEAVRSDNARAQKLLDRENEALRAANEKIEAAYQRMRLLMEQADSIEIDTLQQMKDYLAQISREQIECEARQKKLGSQADQIAEQLKRKLLSARGLENIESKIESDLIRQQEKQETREQEELWSQRRAGRADHD